VEIVAFGGWDRCARFINGDIELLVTLEVGPRIIRFGKFDGPNELKQFEKHSGLTGGDEYRSYGGHRLWIAPEEVPKTYQPDNLPVEVSEVGESTSFRSAPDAYHLQKEIRVRPFHGGFRIDHYIHNRGLYAIELAPWALTVMAVGGTCYVPQPEFAPHGSNLLPARPIVLWPYTNMADSRYTWGEEMILLRQTDGGPTKFGAMVDQGYAAYANHGNVFVKRFDAYKDETYPDFHVNFEAFTRHDMLEVETLGPLETVSPGTAAIHSESWYLLEGPIPEDDRAAKDWFVQALPDCPAP
jgi:hypothetical protein